MTIEEKIGKQSEMRRRGSKRGNSMVEAAMVLPIVILALISTIYILTYMYMDVASKVKIHVALTHSIGRSTDTINLHGKIPKDVSVSSGFGGINTKQYGEHSMNFGGRGLIQRKIVKVNESQIHAIDERRLIRYVDLLGK